MAKRKNLHATTDINTAATTVATTTNKTLLLLQCRLSKGRI